MPTPLLTLAVATATFLQNVQSLGARILTGCLAAISNGERPILGPVVASLLLVLIWIITVRIRVRRATRAIQNHLDEQVRLREAAEAANRVKGEFLANMSHEIRTPMNALVGFTDLARKAELNPELREYLDTVRTSADWLMNIVNDVLEFSRIEAGSLQLDNREFALSECISWAMKIVQGEAAAKNLALRSKIDPQIPARVCGDPIRLRQVIFNLLDNAVKFTTNGSVMLTVALESKSGDALLVRISVADTGIGIPGSKQQFIFEPFRQADGSAVETPGVTGLGLAISRKLVNLMGGTIEFKSQLGAGSTFQFTAWFQKAQSSVEPARPAVSRATPQHLNILVAEDNAINRRLVTKLLESEGHTATPAVNGKQAVQLFAAGKFDLVLMDLEMPEMDGFEATELIRAGEPRGSRVPIYALTAHSQTGDRERCIAGGMDGHISKPIEVDDVLNIIAEVVPAAPQLEAVSAG
jgi:signal transduction histidine kinase/CheY-like chemotaxis protein